MGRLHQRAIAGVGAVAGLALSAAGCAMLTGVGDLEEGVCVDASCGAVVDATFETGTDAGADAVPTPDAVPEAEARAEMEAAAHDADAGAPTGVDVDAAPPPDPGIVCGTGACAAGTEKCCLYDGGTVTSCIEAGNGCGTATAALLCDDPADCPSGNLCCVVFITPTDIDVDCLTSCPDGGPAMCDPNRASCPPGLRCGPSPVLPAGYYTCQ